MEEMERIESKTSGPGSGHLRERRQAEEYPDEEGKPLASRGIVRVGLGCDAQTQLSHDGDLLPAGRAKRGQEGDHDGRAPVAGYRLPRFPRWHRIAVVGSGLL